GRERCFHWHPLDGCPIVPEPARSEPRLNLSLDLSELLFRRPLRNNVLGLRDGRIGFVRLRFQNGFVRTWCRILPLQGTRARGQRTRSSFVRTWCRILPLQGTRDRGQRTRSSFVRMWCRVLPIQGTRDRGQRTRSSFVRTWSRVLPIQGTRDR